MERATSPCPKCKDEKTGISTGLVYHKKRQLTFGETKEDDPTDFQTEEICDKCGGGGRVAYDPGAIPESKQNPVCSHLQPEKSLLTSPRRWAEMNDGRGGISLERGRRIAE